jgi:hypothetical protein
MKSEYSELEMEVIVFSSEDIITASGENEGPWVPLS